MTRMAGITRWTEILRREESIWGLTHAFIILTCIIISDQFLPPFQEYNLISSIVFVAGILIFSVGWKDLGELRFVIEPGQLRTSGIYAIIRHPIYLGLKLMFFGIALLSRSIIGLILIILILIPLHVVRTRKEEAALIRKYGDQYREYRERTIF